MIGMCPCGCGEDLIDAAQLVRDWLTAEKLKPGTDITAEIAAIVERCAEDLS